MIDTLTDKARLKKIDQFYKSDQNELFASDSLIQHIKFQYYKIDDNIKSGTDFCVLRIIQNEKYYISPVSSKLITYTGIFLIGLVLAGWFMYTRGKNQILDPANTVHDVSKFIAQGEIFMPDIPKSKTRNELTKSLLYSLQVHNRIHHGLAFIKSITDGKHDFRYAETDSNDPIKEKLLQMQASLIKIEQDKVVQQKEIEQNRWINEGLAKFAEIIQLNQSDQQVLADLFLSNIVKYTNASQGGIFLINDNDSSNLVVELISAYAYQFKKHITKTIPIE